VTNNKSYSINLIDAYPISVNQLDLDWSNTDYHKLTVVFAYTYWQNNSVQSIGSSLLQTLLSEVTAGISELGLPNPTPDVALPQVYNATSTTVFPTDANGVSVGSAGMG
jgi:hypothetical protein